MLTLLKPPTLRPGDRVAVVAPAGHCPARTLDLGRHALERLGLEVLVPVGAERSDPTYLAGSDEYRVSCFNAALQDPAIKAVLCARGGYGSLRILPELLYARLRLSPKALVGFSDLTALLFACHWRAGVVCFHGPTVSCLAEAHPESIQSLWTAVSSTEPLVFHFSEAVCLRPGIAVGSVLGGNLTTLCHLVGTPFLPPLSGRILFLEDRGEALYRIDRMLTHLIHSGYLGGVAGLILGDFSQCGPREELERLVQERLAFSSCPILAGVPVGHLRANLTLPLGLTATLDAESCTLTYHETATAP
jgi:muramoyltetrapeptide carboxypeptidase